MSKISLQQIASMAAHTVGSLVEAGLNQAVRQPIGQSAAQVGQAAKMVNKAVVQPTQQAVMGTLGITGERMTRVDTAWLRMDSASNLMMITGVWVLKPGITYDDLCERVETRLLQYKRFTQKVVEDPAGATWVVDNDFSMPYHVKGEKLSRAKGATNDSQALRDLVGDLSMKSLSRNRPLWQFHLVENYVGEDGEKASALVARIHHCIADGIALIAVMMSLVDGGEGPPKKNKERVGVDQWIEQTLLKPFGKAQQMAANSLSAANMQQTIERLLNSPKTAQDLMDAVVGGYAAGGMSGIQNSLQDSLPAAAEMAKLGYQVATDAAALAGMPDDSPTRLKGKPGTTKRVAWCEPVPLEAIRSVSKALGCSINDVLLACVSGAITQYLADYDDSARGKEIRAMIPVNLRPLEQAYKLGNRFGLAPLMLPLGIENPVERTFEVRKRMAALKGSYQPLMAFSLLALAGLLVKPAQAALLNLYAKKATAVMTNVPGPATKLKFCGATLDQTMFWVPQSGDIGLGVSILSYGGGVQFGVITDSTLCPDPQAIIDGFEPEFWQLYWAVHMLPWEGDPLQQV
jgi:diacylglycerol O-acyltransferase / wax synthase